jgi:flagellar protein FliS
VATADNVQLIQMLFDGLQESLATARGHIENGNILGKSNALSRAGRIVVGLQGALDFDQGGELANNLNELYSYMTRRILHANANNDVQTLSEVASLVRDISEAWRTLPGLLGDSGNRQVHYAS